MASLVFIFCIPQFVFVLFVCNSKVLGNRALLRFCTGGVVRNHARVLSVASEHDFSNRYTVGGQLSGQSNPATMSGQSIPDPGLLGKRRYALANPLGLEADNRRGRIEISRANLAHRIGKAVFQ